MTQLKSKVTKGIDFQKSTIHTFRGAGNCFYYTDRTNQAYLEGPDHGRIQEEGQKRAPPSVVQFLSSSCSFQRKSCQMTGFYPKLSSWRPRLGNPRSATPGDPFLPEIFCVNISQADTDRTPL